jgi:hypothetical protein
VALRLARRCVIIGPGAEMPDTKTLYDKDFLAWSKEQAEALRSIAGGGSIQPIDWDNIAEEIEDLGKAQQSALSSQIRRIIEHLLKLQYSRTPGPRRGWRASITDARVEIEVLLQRNPSLVTDLSEIVAEEHPRGARKAIAGLERYRDLDPALVARIRATTYTEEQILDDWFPPEPQS